MKYFLIFSMSLLSILVISTDEPFKKKIPYNRQAIHTCDSFNDSYTTANG